MAIEHRREFTDMISPVCTWTLEARHALHQSFLANLLVSFAASYLELIASQQQHGDAVSVLCEYLL